MSSIFLYFILCMTLDNIQLCPVLIIVLYFPHVYTITTLLYLVLPRVKIPFINLHKYAILFLSLFSSVFTFLKSFSQFLEIYLSWGCLLCCQMSRCQFEEEVYWQKLPSSFIWKIQLPSKLRIVSFLAANLQIFTNSISKYQRMDEAFLLEF